jgi:6-phosphofructokinase 1
MSEKKINALIGQSGGPTAAINATLAGVVRGLRALPGCGEIYGAMNGIDGVIAGNIRDIGSRLRTEEELNALECTPSAALGSCRRKLPDVSDTEFYGKIFDRFAEYGIGMFFLIGGNDSMDTVDKLSRFAASAGSPVRIIGVPKTIDNDLEITDHTPGYGSAAKFIATVCEEIAGDCAVYTTKACTIVEIMGRDAGWLTAAAALPRLYGQVCPDLVYLPEVSFDYDEFINSVLALFEIKPNIVVAVSEGIRDAEGRYVGEGSQSGVRDIFGHRYLAGTGKVLEETVRARIGCKVRSIELSLPQRCAGHCLSAADIRESVMIGKAAAGFAAAGRTGEFAVLKRVPGLDYAIVPDAVPVSLVANKIKKVDRAFINAAGNNVTDELLRLIAPMIEGEVAVPMRGGLPERFELKE